MNPRLELAEREIEAELTSVRKILRKDSSQWAPLAKVHFHRRSLRALDFMYDALETALGIEDPDDKTRYVRSLVSSIQELDKVRARHCGEEQPQGPGRRGPINNVFVNTGIPPRDSEKAVVEIEKQPEAEIE